MNEPFFNVLEIYRGTTVDGPGFRTAIYLAGCNHYCDGCHNPQSWLPDTGHKMSLSELLKIVEEEDFNVTLTGGDPLFFPENVKELITAIKDQGRNIWLYTGYTWDEILKNDKLKRAIENVDVVVDGPFIKELKDLDLPFRGSLNQNLIDVKKSLKVNRMIKYK